MTECTVTMRGRNGSNQYLTKSKAVVWLMPVLSRAVFKSDSIDGVCLQMVSLLLLPGEDMEGIEVNGRRASMVSMVSMG